MITLKDVKTQLNYYPRYAQIQYDSYSIRWFVLCFIEPYEFQETLYADTQEDAFELALTFLSKHGAAPK